MSQKYRQRVGHFIRTMVVDKPTVYPDSYRGDALRERGRF